MAIVGYGPVGATAANLLGRWASKSLSSNVIPTYTAGAGHLDRRGGDADLAIGRPGGPAQRTCCPTGRWPSSTPTACRSPRPPSRSRGYGHPPQQFIYQPAVDQVLREGVAAISQRRAASRTRMPAGRQPRRRCRADARRPRTDEFKRIRASYVIAADGGSSPTRGQLGVGIRGRTYSERWIVIDTKVKSGVGRPRPVAVSLQPRAPDRRLPHAAWAPPLGVPARAGEDENETRHRGGRLEGPPRPGHHGERRDHARRRLQPPCPRRRPVAGRAGCSWPVTRRMRCRRGSARACRPVCATSPTCAGNSRPWCAGRRRIRCSTLPGRAQAARHRGHPPRGDGPAAHHRTQSNACAMRNHATAGADAACPAWLRRPEADVDSRRALPRRVFRRRRQPAVGWQIPQPWVIDGPGTRAPRRRRRRPLDAAAHAARHRPARAVG